jgi:hypothetical protein
MLSLCLSEVQSLRVGVDAYKRPASARCFHVSSSMHNKKLFAHAQSPTAPAQRYDHDCDQLGRLLGDISQLWFFMVFSWKILFH